jgi:hypothetical protein
MPLTETRLFASLAFAAGSFGADPRLLAAKTGDDAVSAAMSSFAKCDHRMVIDSWGSKESGQLQPIGRG